ncbi:hypothetical protein H4Q26_017244 [Puccinia striiformis f. sp. tritici PST-130]|nr:hypothetical protein H4Q26_017244 [Puccinia striiformis f. sp. tritici PST-130]
MLYHYCIGSYGNYHNLLHVTNVVRFHYILPGLPLVEVKSFSLRIMGLLGYGKRRANTFHFFILAIGVQQKLRPIVFGPRGRVVQLICGALLTLLKACDLARSKAVRQMLVSNQDLLRYVSSILCLLCQTAIFPTIFDLVSLYLRNAKGAGIGYTMM